MTVARGRMTALVASLVTNFHLKPWEIARLTWRQIAEVYFHDRDENGDIKIPDTTPILNPATMSFEQKVGALNQSADFLGDEQYRRLMVELHEKYQQPLPKWWGNLPKTQEPVVPKPKPKVEPKKSKSRPPITRKKNRGP